MRPCFTRGIPALPVPSISVRLILFAHSFHNQPDTVPEALIISKASIFNRQIILGGYRPVNSLKLFIPEAFVFDLLLHFVGICFRFYVPAVGFCACIMSVSMLCSHKNSNNCSMSLKPFLYNSPSGSLLSLPQSDSTIMRAPIRNPSAKTSDISSGIKSK